MNPATILIVSVPHTGTQFTLQLLRGKRPRTMHYWRMGANKARRLAGKYRMVIPLRHPLKVALTWKARGHHSLDMLAALWPSIIKGMDPYEPCYLPLDVPDREDYLAAMNAKFGLNVSTDWARKGHEPHGGVELTEQEQAAVLVQMDELSGFFGRFYHD